MVLIASVDVGTTSVRCVVFDDRLQALSCARVGIDIKRPRAGFVEIEPERLLASVCDVIRGAVKKADKSLEDVTSLTLTTQRGSFVTWNHTTSATYHNIVCWNDLRANRMVKQCNSSWKFRCGALLCGILYRLTGSQRYLAASIIRMMNEQVTLRLLWCIENMAELRDGIHRGVARFGTLDTFLLYRLTAGRIHVTDTTSASATGFFDLFLGRWSAYARWMFGAPPPSMLPEVVPCCSLHQESVFGETAIAALPVSLPVRCVMGDQSASLFGSGCWLVGDVCVILGTGAFVAIVTGDKPYTSVQGLYPQVAWRVGEETCYSAEGSAGDAAGSVLWGQQIGLYDDVALSGPLADSVPDSAGVFFVPAFSGLAAPVNDYQAASGFIGVDRGTTRAHLTHALLSSICFRVAQLYACLRRELPDTVAAGNSRPVCVTGGVAKSDFICQLIADLLAVCVFRPISVETTAIGAAALSGLTTGVWSDREHLRLMLRRGGRVFTPDRQRGDHARQQMNTWEEALSRFGQWYK